MESNVSMLLERLQQPYQSFFDLTHTPYLETVETWPA